MAPRKSSNNGSGDDVVLTVKDAVMEIRDDVKSLTNLIGLKANQADLNALSAAAIRKDDAVIVAKQVADDAIRAWQDTQASQRREDKAWIKPMAWSVGITLILGIANLVARIGHIGG